MNVRDGLRSRVRLGHVLVEEAHIRMDVALLGRILGARLVWIDRGSFCNEFLRLRRAKRRVSEVKWRSKCNRSFRHWHVHILSSSHGSSQVLTSALVPSALTIEKLSGMNGFLAGSLNLPSIFGGSASFAFASADNNACRYGALYQGSTSHFCPAAVTSLSTLYLSDGSSGSREGSLMVTMLLEGSNLER